MHQVKTRNFNCSPLAARLLELSKVAGVQGGTESDGDGKFHLATASAFKAWAVGAYFMACRPLSGGWTYIVRHGHDLGDGYKSVY